MKNFAEQYPRDEDGLILFPSDVALRKEKFVPESMKHPAKANIHMVMAIVEYLMEGPNDLFVDIFGGTGTLLLAEQMFGVEVGVIELNPEFQQLILSNINKLSIKKSWLYPGPNQKYFEDQPHWLKWPSAFVFSPPYSGAIGTGGGRADAVAAGTSFAESAGIYSQQGELRGNQTSYNLATMNNFIFNQEMVKIYKLCYDALKPGGYIVSIIKDRISKGVKEELGFRTLRDMVGVGFEFYEWARWKPPGSQYTKDHKAKGRVVVEDEHIIMCRRPR